MVAIPFILLLYISSLAICNGDVIVETSTGRVSGIQVKSILENEKYYSFMGIPYAEPPVGELRFMPPFPHNGWSDILSVKKEKNSCAQNRMPIRGAKNFGYCGSEDCLYLSIHTPTLPHEDDDVNLPVIVFLHNEQFRMSSNNSIDYGPDFFMNEEVILVTVNHRLGALGFLSFEDDLLPGNNGIRDVIVALYWIKVNINKFGGDPNKITLMGYDGGAVIVDILLHTPKVRGLFVAAILQSGNLWNSLNIVDKRKERAIELSEKLDENVFTSSNLLKRLNTKSSLDITVAEESCVHADESRAIQVGILPFGPIVEHEHSGAVFTKIPEAPFDINVPVMIGYNSREGIEVTERYLHKPQYLTFADRDFLFLFPIKTNYHFDIHSSVYYDAIQEVKDFYFDEGYIKVSKPGEFVTYIGDVMSFYPIDYGVRKYINGSNVPVYYYMFDYSGELNKRKNDVLSKSKSIDGTWGATMGDDLCYLFVCKSIKKIYKKAIQDDDSEDMKIVNTMVKMWTNFAKTGNPTPPGEQFVWKPASKNEKNCLVINEELQMKSNVHQETVDFWDNFLQKYEAKAIDGVVTDNKNNTKNKDEL
ncbi:esterase E4-like [Achroia grisella]|uniref:esterase E4-like n=1 Tax=Achroia grisella TaxID=688607 RepID=UPI0027D2A943|nr:esterase E4-like [Achroia grisella]